MPFKIYAIMTQRLTDKKVFWHFFNDKKTVLKTDLCKSTSLKNLLFFEHLKIYICSFADYN
jgi:hypothetical protein